MQNNNSSNQNASLKAGQNQNPDQNVKPKFKCKDCDFHCSSLQNFRIHLQMAHQTTNETIEKLNALKKAVEEIKKVQPVRNFQPEIKNVNPTGNVQAARNVNPAGNVKPGAVQKPTIISKPFVPYAQAVRNVNPAGNVQPGVMKMTPAIRHPFVLNAQAERNLNPTGNVQPGAVQTPSSIRKPFVPNVQAIMVMNPAGNVQPGAVKMTHKIRKPFIPNAQVIKKLNPMDNVQPVQGKKVIPARNIQPEKQKEKPAVQPEIIPESIGRNIVKLKDYMSRRDREPLIGLEYVLEYNTKSITNQIEPKYFCELCECDLELDPMVEHLAGFGHRKLYLAKEYPYVLKAQSSSKEDPSQFIRRMALEIEREEGTKMYLVDSSIWPDTMMTLRTADRKMRKKSRWSDDKNDETRMKKALAYLESFEIDSEIEATTVTRLCEKLTANLKFYSTNAMQVALFPSRVAKAQDVAMSLVKNVANQRRHNAKQKKSKANKRPPSLEGNSNLEKVGIRSGFPGNNFQNSGAVQNMQQPPPYQQQGQQNAFNPPMDAKQNLLGAPLYQQAPQNTFVPPMNANQNVPRAPLYHQAQQNAFVSPMNAKQNMPSAQPYQLAWKKTFVPLNANQSVPEAFTSKENETSQKADDSILKNISQDDTQFFKKLVSLLEALPQNAPLSEGTQPNSKLQMLKSLLLSQKNAEQEQANLKLMTQIASMVKDTITAQNANLNQHLMMLMTSQNSTPMVMPTAPLNNSLMAPMQINNNSAMNTAGLASGIQGVGNMPMNMNSMMPYQNFGTQVYGQMGEIETKSMNPNAYQVPPAQMQNYPSTSQTINPQPTSQSLNYNSYGNSSQVVNPKYDDLKETPYSRVGLPAGSSQTPRNDYYDNTRGELGMQEPRPQNSLRSYNSSDWDDQGGDMPYIKRARLEEHTKDESLESLGINTAGMPEELLKRLRGKDLFTASAILSEYSERRSGK
ncbi:uncharacterized protein [Phyllobates terribilis]|uniref:uncharacterized protein n=1 Tax=Phyllobates terribilis TaxID=111132 RepID=UPI003CCB5008